eukprot:CAMPEP_0202971346 /NCGR_PEP_ID=MMETSP1396-20130829/26342_1 /ASSEMBLY_ACC=CAM_ASM_000872 /TAXON_ID= /ORGANISM="Pseudokeronopsis sp., Strain Brazil" /LENGTH=280 /DNA_ID=CAMNT_0049700627 /DNA_START=71 /DNA_END=913 /DNA_ORIENTATION=-
MFARILLALAVLVAVVGAALDSKLLTQLREKHNARKFAKPSSRKVSEAAIKAQTIPTKYLSIYNYEENSNCQTAPTLVMGLAYDTCIVGEVEPSTGAPLTSVMYYSNEAGDTYMSYFSEAGDCTGASTDNIVVVPTPCINTNMKVLREDSTVPWSEANADGVVMKFFDSAEACAAGGAGYDFMWYSATMCIPDVAEDLSYMSYKYSGCDANGVTVIYYSDRFCSTVLRTETTALSDCMSTTSNLQPAWISQSCTDYVPPSPTDAPTNAPTDAPTEAPTEA